MSDTVEPLTDAAKEIHLSMLTDPSKTAFSQDDLKSISGIDDEKSLMELLQSLINHSMIKLLESKDKSLMFAAVSVEEAKKVQNMSVEEAIIYSYIESAGREGIWTKTIKAKTSLHQQVISRCLKTLENQSYVKAVKSVKFPQRKIYMLYNLTPSVEVTGGPWFNGTDLDVDFIDSLLIVVWRFIASKTFPEAFQMEGYSNGLKQLSYDSNYLNLYSPTLDDILNFIIESNITTVELSMGDIRALCDVLEYEDKIEKFNGNYYKATLQSILESGGGLISGVDPLQPQQDEFFNINDSYRVVADVQQNDVNVFLDSWHNI